MTIIPEARLEFVFQDNWQASKYDEWSWYRNQFERIQFNLDGKDVTLKGVDIVAVAPDRGLWLIEAKDYRYEALPKPSDLPQAVAKKVLDTLSGLFTARFRAANEERRIARMCTAAQSLHVTLVVALPRVPSRLFRRVVDPADIQAKIRQLIHQIDAHPKVYELTSQMPWQVRTR